MALQLQGTLKTEWGNTETAYIRIEFYKVQPWFGQVEYNPLIFLHAEDASISRKEYYQDDLAPMYAIPLRDMHYESGSITGSFELPEILTFPLTGSAVERTINHYTESITSASVDVVDFDEDGNEITVTEWTYTTESIMYSQSIVEHNPISLDSLSSIYQDCYTHLKSTLATQIPSGSILDV